MLMEKFGRKYLLVSAHMAKLHGHKMYQNSQSITKKKIQRAEKKTMGHCTRYTMM